MKRGRRTFAQRHITRNDHHPNPSFGESSAHGQFEDSSRHLLWLRQSVAVMAAILEQVLRMCLLKIAASDLMARNLRRNRKHWYATPMAIEEAVDEVKIARPAAAGTYRNVPRR